MKRTLLTAALFAFAAPAYAEPEALTALYACAGVANVAERAACYDAATSALRSAVQAGQVSVIGNADLQALQKDVFGYQAPVLPALLAKSGAVAPVNDIETSIAKLNRGDPVTFILENEQTWVQADTESTRALRAGDKVRVERRALGSYLMIPQNGGAAIRVRRVN